MRTRVWSAMAAVVMVAAAGCVPDPTVPATSPYACGAGPVSLGDGMWISTMSDDGTVLVTNTANPDGSSWDSWLVDRTAGTRTLLSTSAAHLEVDSLARLSADGKRVAWTDYLGSKWTLLDRTTGVTTDLFIYTHAFFDTDLRTVLSGNRLVDVATGASTPAAAGFGVPNPSLQLTATHDGNPLVRILDTRSGALVRTIPIEPMDWSDVHLKWVDEWTLLVDDARPLGAPEDAIPSDDAFVVDVITGAVTRVDPGRVDALTYSATPDGSRSMYWGSYVGTERPTYVRIAGRPDTLVGTGSQIAPDAALKVFASPEDDKIVLRCA